MFGKYKQSITTTLVSSYATNKKLFKESFHNLMGGLRENKIAREFFVLYGEIENKRFDDKKLAEEYLNTVINTLKSKKKNYWHFPWLLTPPSSKILKNKKIKQS